VTIIVITDIVALIIVAVISGIRFSGGAVRRILGLLDPHVDIILGVACTVALCAWIIVVIVNNGRFRLRTYCQIIGALKNFGLNPESRSESTRRAFGIHTLIPFLGEIVV
jgi:hypothetical protein